MTWLQWTIGGACLWFGVNILFVVYREVRHRQKMNDAQYRQYWWDQENRN